MKAIEQNSTFKWCYPVQVKWSADAAHLPQYDWKSIPEQHCSLNTSALLDKVRVKKNSVCLTNCLVMKIRVLGYIKLLAQGNLKAQIRFVLVNVAKKTETLFTPYPCGDCQFLQLNCLLFSVFPQKNSQSPCSM